jgi:DNA-binding MarR family transcriptional regulator
MLRNKSLSKTELINLMVTEKTSGTETIKRLLKKEMLEEIKLIDNKKSVHVKITDKGIQTISDVMPLIDKVTKIISGNLTDEELNFLSSILKKLDVFHNEIYFDKNTTTLDQIYDKVSIAN